MCIVFKRNIALEQNHNVLEFCLYGNAATPSCKNVETLMKNRSFLLQIAASDISVRYNTHLHSKLFLQVLNMVLYCLTFSDIGKLGLTSTIKIISQNKVQCLKYFYNCCTAVAAMIIEKSLISDG